MMTVVRTLFTTILVIMSLLVVLVLVYTVLSAVILGIILMTMGSGLQHVFAILMDGFRDM